MFKNNDSPSLAYDILALVKPKHPKTEAEIEYRFAERYVGCDDKLWEGRIIEAAEINESVEGELKLTPVFSDFNLTLSNHDGKLTDALMEHVWSQAEVTIYAVPKGASSVSEGLTIFKGYIAKDNGVEVDGDEVCITIEDMLKKYDIELPRRTYKKYMELIEQGAGYIADGKQDDYAPILFGNWQDTDGQYKIPVACVDTRSDGDNRVTFLLCDTAPDYGGYQVDDFGEDVKVQHYDGSTDEIPIVGTNLSQGRCWVYPYAYQDNDEFFIYPKGLKASGSGLLLENPAFIANVLMQAYAGIPSELIDNTSKLIAESATKHLKIRRFINEQKKLGDILAELGFETGLRVRSNNGKIYFYVPDWFAVNLNWTTYGKAELLEQPKFALDPDGLAAGKWLGKAKYNPKTESFEIEGESGEADMFGIAIDQELEFNWLYDRSDLLNKILALEYLFGRHIPKIFEFTLSHAALELKPLDGFWQELPTLFDDPQPFLTLETEKDFVNGTITVKALWLGYAFDAGRWTSNSHPSYEDSTDWQRRYWGYWTYPDGTEEEIDPEKVGRCDPDDPDSDMSNWTP